MPETLSSADAAILFIMGQSNAHAHQQALPLEACIHRPMQNVWTLRGADHRTLKVSRIRWSGYTTQDSNLGEQQDDTARLSYFAAKVWQTAIHQGALLPDLYIVQISIGAQGIMNGMWNMEKEAVFHPGTLENIDISLFPFAKHLLRLVREDINARFQTPAFLGLHWLGSEEDTVFGVARDHTIQETYLRFFSQLLAAIAFPCPLYLYQLLLRRKETVEDLDSINETFRLLCSKLPDTHLVETDHCPLYDEGHPTFGIFAGDQVHYLSKTQQWFAENLFSNLFPKEQVQKMFTAAGFHPIT